MIRLLSIGLWAGLLLSCNGVNGPGEDYATPMGCYVPATTDRDWYSSGKKAPLIAGLSGIHFNISTSNKEAQTYFNQGMMLAYGFNHAEAARSFFEAARIDPACAMAHWGYAYVLGPNYNAGMDDDNAGLAYEAIQKAQSLAEACTPKEAALIKAMTLRYPVSSGIDRRSADVKYADAMKQVYAQYPNDPDIGALYAESLMNLHPWDLYEKQSKAPRAWTPGLIALLETLISKHPRHAGIHHLYVHAMEASATPEKALPSARLLDTLVPGAGHLLHMPSHIYINTGDYHLGSLANIRAIEADSSYTTACHAQGVYPLSYYPHNYHFLAATATLEGRSAWAWMAARKLQQHTSPAVMRMPGWGTLQHYYTIPYQIAVKFSLTDSLLALPPPPEDLVYPRAIWHYARGMVWANSRQLAAAQQELDSLLRLFSDTTLQHLTIWEINTMDAIVQIAAKVLSAKIALHQHLPEVSIALLREAVILEDALNYNEPPDWFFSVRHHLGAALLEAGHFAEAEKIYREDLRTWRKNGWALMGLYHALLAQNNTAESRKVKADFDEAWQHADVKIVSSSGVVN